MQGAAVPRPYASTAPLPFVRTITRYPVRPSMLSSDRFKQKTRPIERVFCCTPWIVAVPEIPFLVYSYICSNDTILNRTVSPE